MRKSDKTRSVTVTSRLVHGTAWNQGECFPRGAVSPSGNTAAVHQALGAAISHAYTESRGIRKNTEIRPTSLARNRGAALTGT